MSKTCYLGHRKYLPRGHKYRMNRQSFDGNVETGLAPKPLSGTDVIEQLQDYEQITFGKVGYDNAGKKRKREDDSLPHNWKKFSIFFKLPYWKDLLVRHNLDPMHIEKNNIEIFWDNNGTRWKNKGHIKGTTRYAENGYSELTSSNSKRRQQILLTCSKL